MKTHIGKLVETFWQQFLVYVVIVGVVVGFLWYQLGTLVPGFSAAELMARGNANAAEKIIADPLFLPHKLLQYLFMQTGNSGAFWMRSVSAIFGVIVLVIFYDIIRSWYTRRVALMAGFLFVSSAWFLHFARIGTPNVLFMLSIGLLWVGMKLRSAHAPRIRTILASMVIVLCCLYVPGLAWLIIPMLVWQRKLIWEEFSKIPKLLSVVVGLGIFVSLTPLVYALVNTPSLVKAWLLIPNGHDVGLWVSNAWHIPTWLSLRGPINPTYWLGHVPLFDVFSLSMLVLGLFVLNYYRLLDRVQALAAIIALSLVIVIFNGWIPLLIALPLFFVIIAAGIALFLQQWFTVFPRNPLARFVGVTAVSFLILLAGYYNYHAYFVAWPKATETKIVFSLRS
jgi:Dolichyl-phosphate-mannose-protein mannosyltransferase